MECASSFRFENPHNNQPQANHPPMDHSTHNALMKIIKNEHKNLLQTVKDNNTKMVKIDEQRILKSSIYAVERGKSLLYASLQRNGAELACRLNKVNTESLQITASKLIGFGAEHLERLSEQEKNPKYQVKTSLSKNENILLFYFKKEIVEYRIAESELILHKVAEIEVDGHFFKFCDVDCLNEDFDQTVILELYNSEAAEGNLAFYSYNLTSKKFKKIFAIPNPNDPERPFWHSYNKIDRKAIHGSRDALIVLRFHHKNSSGSFTADLFYIDIQKRNLLKQLKIELPRDFGQLRQPFAFSPFLLNSQEVFALRLGHNSVLAVNKVTWSANVIEHDQFFFKPHLITDELEENINGRILCMAKGVGRERLEKGFLPAGNYAFYEFGEYVLVIGNNCVSELSVGKFEKLENYVVVDGYVDPEDVQRKFYVLQFPFK